MFSGMENVRSTNNLAITAVVSRETVQATVTSLLFGSK